VFKSEDADQGRNAPSATEQSGEIALLTAAQTHNDTKPRLNRKMPPEEEAHRR
jgi:hypothetical protein